AAERTPGATQARQRWAPTRRSLGCRPSPPPPTRQPGNERRYEHDGEPSLPPSLSAQAVDAELTTARQKRWQRSRSPWLRAGRDRESTRRRGDQFVSPRTRVKVRVADFRQHEIPGRVRHCQKPERLAAGDSPAFSGDANF